MSSQARYSFRDGSRLRGHDKILNLTSLGLTYPGDLVTILT